MKCYMLSGEIAVKNYRCYYYYYYVCASHVWWSTYMCNTSPSFCLLSMSSDLFICGLAMLVAHSSVCWLCLVAYLSVCWSYPMAYHCALMFRGLPFCVLSISSGPPFCVLAMSCGPPFHVLVMPSGQSHYILVMFCGLPFCVLSITSGPPFCVLAMSCGPSFHVLLMPSGQSHYVLVMFCGLPFRVLSISSGPAFCQLVKMTVAQTYLCMVVEALPFNCFVTFLWPQRQEFQDWLCRCRCVATPTALSPGGAVCGDCALWRCDGRLARGQPPHVQQWVHSSCPTDWQQRSVMPFIRCVPLGRIIFVSHLILFYMPLAVTFIPFSHGTRSHGPLSFTVGRWVDTQPPSLCLTHSVYYVFIMSFGDKKRYFSMHTHKGCHINWDDLHMIHPRASVLVSLDFSGDVCPVGAMSFEFVVPDGVPVALSPTVGTVLPGQVPSWLSCFGLFRRYRVFAIRSSAGGMAWRSLVTHHYYRW